MGAVAASAGVSKALVHYHFHDKDSLLAALVEEVGRGIVERARDAAQGDAGEHALDKHWAWLERELALGELRVVISLGEYDNDRVREASRRVAQERREIAAAHTAAIFERFGLRPRVPAGLIAETLIAFVDGLATRHALDPERDTRPAFDVLWLALLTLAE